MGINKRSGAAAKENNNAAASSPKDASQEKQPRRTCLHNQLHKTKFCMYHLKGACQYGTDCAFAHSCSELQATPDLRKTRLCVAFMEGGGCNDSNCTFAHGEEELRSTDMFYKKTLCIWNEKGKCRNGDQCRFAHGLAELRASQGHYASGLLAPEEADKTAQHGATKSSRRRKAKAGATANTDAVAAEPMKIMPRSMVDSQPAQALNPFGHMKPGKQVQGDFAHLLHQRAFMNGLYGNADAVDAMNANVASMLLGPKAVNPGMAAMYNEGALMPPPGFDNYGLEYAMGLSSFHEAMGA